MDRTPLGGWRASMEFADEILRAANSQQTLEQSLPHYTREARARREMLMAAIESETELYRSRMEEYERKLQEIERKATIHRP